MSLINPYEEALISGNTDLDQGPITLLNSGVYRLKIQGSADAIGDYRFRLLAAEDQRFLPYSLMPRTILTITTISSIPN